MNSHKPATDPLVAARTARIIWAAMLCGILALAGVLAFLKRDAVSDASAFSDSRLPIWIWIAFALSSAIGAILVWRSSAEPLIEGRTPADDAPRRTGDQVGLTSALMVCWALLEGASLLGLVLFFLSGHWILLVATLAFALAGFGMSAPRKEWFGVSERRP